MTKRIRGRRAVGFTLIELLVVVLVLAILMAVALPLYLAAITDSEKKTCRANMWSIAQAEQAFKVKTSAHAYTTSLSDLNPDLGHTPVCPTGGIYSIVISDGTQTSFGGITVPSGGLIVQCSVSAHGKFAPGFDAE